MYVSLNASFHDHMMDIKLKHTCPLLHSFLCILHLYNLIPWGAVCAVLYTLDCCGVHWVQCSEAAILAQ